MDIQAISEFLKSLRRAKGLTQEEVANLLYLSPKTISRWESGNGIPDINIISSVAELYEVSVDEILKGKRNSITKNELSTKTIQLQSKNKEKIINNQILNKLNLYFIVGTSILYFFLFIEIIIGFALNELISVILMPLGMLTSIIVMVIGNNEIKNYFNDETNDEIINFDNIKFNIRKKNIFFCDLIIIDLLVSLLIFMILLYN